MGKMKKFSSSTEERGSRANGYMPIVKGLGPQRILFYSF